MGITIFTIKNIKRIPEPYLTSMYFMESKAVFFCVAHIDASGFSSLKPIDIFQEISGPFLNRPLKPEYQIARSQLTERGPLGFGPIELKF